jgi:hypothetical protein
MRIKLEKITYHKLELKDEIENKLKFYEKGQEQKLKMKRRTGVDI